MGSVLEETGRPIEIQACGGKGGERKVYVSTTHLLRVKVYSHQLAALDPFLLKYEGITEKWSQNNSDITVNDLAANTDVA